MSNLGEEIRMFNPLSSDTKVAITTTTAKDPRPCLLTNYNSDVRLKGLGEYLKVCQYCCFLLTLKVTTSYEHAS